MKLINQQQTEIRKAYGKLGHTVKFEKAFPLRFDWFCPEQNCPGHRYFEQLGCKKANYKPSGFATV